MGSLLNNVLATIALIGIGSVGSIALQILTEEHRDLKLLAIDTADRTGLIKSLGASVEFHRVSAPADIIKAVKEVDVVATAVPSSAAFSVVNQLLSHGCSVVDVSFTDFDPYMFEQLCRRQGTFYIVDAGLSPGFSNLVIGYAHSKLGRLDRAIVYVGGIPLEPVPPIGYQVTWSPEDLIEEYTRRARIVTGGREVEVDPLERTLEVELPGVGVFEGFYCDGLRTLLRNVEADEMYDVTIRHKGHLRAMKLLRSLGFFDRDAVEVNGCMVTPRRFTAKIFERSLRQTVPDQALIYVDVAKGLKYHRVLAKLVGSLSRPATAYFTALMYVKTIVLALREKIEPGVWPLEALHRYYEDYVKNLRQHGVQVLEETNVHG